MAIWTWASLWEGRQQTLEDKPHLARWLEDMCARPDALAGRALFAEKRAGYLGDTDLHARLAMTKQRRDPAAFSPPSDPGPQ